MKNQLTAVILVIFAGAFSVACSDDSSSGGTGGSGNNGGAGNNGGSSNAGDGVELVADETGFVKADAVGIQGAWYAYADSIGSNGMPPGNCQSVGMHPDSECANVQSPAAGSFPNTGNKLCTKGTLEAVGMLNGSTDYDNQWGAGIGLDFNNPGMGATKMPFDMAAAGITGVSFEIDNPPAGGLRVEFPDAATDGKSAAYWGADKGVYPPSPVKQGVNTIMWADVTPPATTVPALDKTKVMGIQFHVTTGSSPGAYEFCISKLTVLK
jgi:hypothetical protein